MSKGIFAIIFASLLAFLLLAYASCQDNYTQFPYVVEAEDLKGSKGPETTIDDKTIKGQFSGQGFVYLVGRTLTMNLTVPEDGMYEFSARVAQIVSPSGRQQTISINKIDFKYSVPYTEEWIDFDFGMHKLVKGDNVIRFKPQNGYAAYDKFTVKKAEFPDITTVSSALSDPKATPEAKKVQEFLASVYGKKIVSGQQEIYGGGNNGDYELEFKYIYDLTGKYPAIRGFDLMNYNPLYGWDDQTTERIIDWVNNRGGIATASWHLNVPKEFEKYTLGQNLPWTECTYGVDTDFKTENAFVEGTKENDYWNSAINLLAFQLKRLQDANVPLIFRPLHEAEGNANTDGSGAWFWWGKAGAQIYVQLWRYLYKKLTQEFGLHNLIWEQNLYAWNADSVKWYGGDNCVDIVGYDKYNVVYNRHDGKTSGPNLDAETPIFYALVKSINNKKMIAMAENDSIPGVNNLITEKAGWLYFCPWYGEHLMDEGNNAKEDLKEIYTNPYCITLDDLPFKQSSQQTYTEFPYVVEAENLKGAKGPETTINDQTIKGQYSGEGFVYLVGKTLTINVTVPEDGMYEFSARVAQIVSPSGRQQTISINKIDFKYSVPYTEEWIDFDFGMHKLVKGDNVIRFKPQNGYAAYDKFTVKKAEFPDITTVSSALSDPKATPEAKKVQEFLASVYGKKIVSGQQEIYGGGNNGDYELEFKYIYDLTGKYPAIRGFDLMNYNPLYGWDDQTTERIIDWVNNRGGIATASWHLNVPKEFEKYTLGQNLPWTECTYGVDTDFKTENAFVEGTKENDYWNSAINLLAFQLKRLQDANVPLIFRPLHEAEGNANTDGSGAWFWWGKAGAQIYVQLWRYLYKKLTQEFGLHNLIWEQNLYAWNADSVKWYGGDNCVDIVGYDKYNVVYNRHDGKTSGPNLDAETPIFYALVKSINNKKMIAMAENDSIPGVNNLITEKAGWLYFCPWYGEHLMDEGNNSKEDLKEIYTNEYCITLEDLPFKK